MGKYWDSDGEYQEWVDGVEEIVPDMYYTNNKYMNIFIAISKLYYDIYNNGGGNIEDGCFEIEIEMIKDFLGTENFRLSETIEDYDYLEEKTNEIFKILMEQDLSFENSGFWNNGIESKISLKEQVGDNWSLLTCGTYENMMKEFNNRKNCGFEEVA